MGLESHITQVLENEPASGLRFGYDYWFYDGLTCKDRDTAERVVEQLYESDQFGYMSIVGPERGSEEVKILFEPMLRRID